ncbi:MAG TPA: hypothetical protein VK616_11010, partial [Flavitalea sp.]|nr:hypothetical protein [Flavitalea sp.]
GSALVARTSSSAIVQRISRFVAVKSCEVTDIIKTVSISRADEDAGGRRRPPDKSGPRGPRYILSGTFIPSIASAD